MVTKQQIIDFIFDQPDDRRVDMRENLFDHDCGCIGVHYCGDKGIEFTSFEKRFSEFSPYRDYTFVGTYKDIKKFLIQKNWLPSK